MSGGQFFNISFVGYSYPSNQLVIGDWRVITGLRPPRLFTVTFRCSRLKHMSRLFNLMDLKRNETLPLLYEFLILVKLVDIWKYRLRNGVILYIIARIIFNFIIHIYSNLVLCSYALMMGTTIFIFRSIPVNHYDNSKFYDEHFM